MPKQNLRHITTARDAKPAPISRDCPATTPPRPSGRRSSRRSDAPVYSVSFEPVELSGEENLHGNRLVTVLRNL